MSERLRAVLIGLVLGVGPLLLLDLARILRDAAEADGTGSWWALAVYAAVGLLVGVGVGLGRSDRLVPAVAAVVVVVAAVLPAAGVGGWLAGLPLAASGDVAQAVAVTVAGAYVYATVRGGGR